MNKILVFDKRKDADFSKWNSAADKLNISVTSAHFADLLFHFSSNHTIITVQHIALSDFTLIFFRKKFGFEEEVVLLTRYAEQHDIRIADSVLSRRATYIDRKSYECLLLSMHRIPFIESWGCRASSLQQQQLPNLAFPLVVKATDVNRGEGVFLAKNNNELMELTKKMSDKFILLQPFIENDGDVRVLVIGNKVVAAIKRSRVSKTDFRNNVSQGATSTSIKLDEIVEQTAISAAKALAYDVAGVDLMYDKQTQRYLVMEVNCGPQYDGLEQATGLSIATETLVYFKQL